MTETVKREADPNIFWECPDCGYRVGDVEYLYVRVDLPCSRCQGRQWSEFTHGKWKVEAQ